MLVNIIMLLLVLLLLSCGFCCCRAHEYRLPNIDTTFEVGGVRADLQATDIKCFGLSVRNLAVSWGLENGQQQTRELHLEANVSDFRLDCYLNYAYSSVSASGNNNGSAFVLTDPNSLDLVLDVVIPKSSQIDAITSTTVLIRRCNVNIQFSDVHFLTDEPLGSEFLLGITDNLVSSVCKLLEDPTQLSRFFLDDFQDGGSKSLTDLANNLQAKEERYLQEIEHQRRQSSSSPYQLIDFTRSVTWPAWGATGFLGWLGQYLGQTVTRESGQGVAINFLLHDIWGAPAAESSNSSMLVVNLTTPLVPAAASLASNNTSKNNDDKTTDPPAVLLLDQVLEAASLAINNSGKNNDDKTTDQPAVLLLDQVHVLEHDPVTQFTNFSFVGQHSFQVNLALHNVHLRVLGSLYLRDTNDASTVQEDRVMVDFFIQNVDATLVFFLAIDEDELGAITLGALLRNNEGYDNDVGVLIHCLASSVVRVTLADSAVRSIAVREDPSGDDLLRIRAAGVEFDSLTVLFNVLPLLLSSKNERTGVCSSPDSKTTHDEAEANSFIDFRDLLLEPTSARSYGGTGTQPYGSVLSTAKAFLMNELLVVDPTTGQLRINMDFMAPFTQAQSGQAGVLDFDSETGFPLFSNVFVGRMAESHFHLELQRIRVTGLNKFGLPTAVSVPSNSSGFVVNNIMSLQSLELAAVVRASLYVDFLGNITVDDIAWTIELSELALVLEILAVLYTEKFLELSLLDLLNFNCWLAAIPSPIEGSNEETLSLLNAVLKAEAIQISAQCYECGTSPSFRPATEVYRTLNDFFERLLTSMRGSDTLLQEQINRMILEAPRKCRHHPSYEPDGEVANFVEGLDLSQSQAESAEFTTLYIVTNAIMVGFILFMVFLFLVAHLVMVRRHRVWLQSLEPDHVDAIYEEQERIKKRQRLIDAAAGCMLIGEAVPAWVRWLVPLLLLVSICLQFAGFWLNSLGGSLLVQLVGENVFALHRKSSIYSFVRLLWANDSKPLAVTVWVGVVGIPLAKFVGIMGLWFFPTCLVSTSKRLFFLDILYEIGRTDVIVIFIFFLLLACVNIRIASDISSLSGTSLYEVNLLMYPVYGLYVWTMGLYACQGTCRIFRHYHIVSVEASTAKVDCSEKAVTTSDTNNDKEKQRRIRKLSSTFTMGEISDDINTGGCDEELRDVERPCNDEPVSVLCDTVFVQPYHNTPSNHFRVRPATNIIVGIVGVVVVGLVTAGCIVPVVTIDATGVITDLIHFGEEGARVNTIDLSVISVATGLVRNAAMLNSGMTAVGLWLFAIFTLLTVVVTPILRVCGLFVQWFSPLHARNRDTVSFFTEQFRAWQHTQFFMIASLCVAGSLPSILDTSRSLIGPFCEALGGILLVGVKAGLLEGQEVFCHVLTPSLRVGALLLLVGSFGVELLYGFISAASDQMTLPDSTARIADFSSERMDPTVRADNDKQAKIKQISVPAAVFSQRFRWFLCRADGHTKIGLTCA